MKVGDDVVDVKVDESEVNVVVEEEEKEVVVVESIFVVVSMRKLRGGRDTNLCQLSWTSCKYCGFCHFRFLLKLRVSTTGIGNARGRCSRGVNDLQPRLCRYDQCVFDFVVNQRSLCMNSHLKCRNGAILAS